MSAVTALASPVPFPFVHGELPTAAGGIRGISGSSSAPPPPSISRSFSEAPTPRLGLHAYRTLADAALAPSSSAGVAAAAAADVEMKSDRVDTAMDAAAEDETGGFKSRPAPASRSPSTADTPFLSQGEPGEADLAAAAEEAQEALAVRPELGGVDESAEDEMSMDSPLLPSLPAFDRPLQLHEEEDEEEKTEADRMSRSLSRQSTLVGESAFADAAAAAAPRKASGSTAYTLALPPPVIAAVPQAIRRSNALAAPSPERLASPGRKGVPARRAGAAAGGASSSGHPSTPPIYRMEDLVDASVRMEPDTSALPLRARAAAATCCGGVKSVNQDAFVCASLRTGAPTSASFFRPDALVLAVADGHGMLGHSASALVARELPLLLQSALLEGASEESALRHAVRTMDAHMKEDARNIRGVAMRALMPLEPPPIMMPPARRSSRTGNGNGANGAGGAGTTDKSNGGSSPNSGGVARSPVPSAPATGLMGADYGTTLVACVLRGRRLSVAHVGDSRFMLFQRLAPNSSPAAAAAAAASGVPSVGRGIKLTRQWQLVFCTTDHSAEDLAEAARVQREGGRLHYAEQHGGVGGDVRVYPDCFSLEEARSKALTLNMSRSLGHIKLGLHGVSSEPDVTSFNLSPGVESCVVMGSDGLTDVLSTELICTLVTPGSPEEIKQNARELLHVAEDRWVQRAEATQRRLGDNITAAVLRVFDVAAADA